MKNKVLKNLMLFVMLFGATSLYAQEYKVCWSHYTGWEPWAYADHSGILKKWADKYKIKIKLVRINDYVESINLFTAKEYQACTMTNMDALTIPAVGGIDSEALIVGDFSDGNDGIVIKGGNSVKALKGRKVKLVQFSVSHYLLSRALQMNGMKEKDLTVVNTSDADIGSLFLSEKNAAVVTWNPILMSIENAKGAKKVFDSSKIPGEIIDLMVVHTDAPETLKKALVGAWYDTMKVMSGKDAAAEKALAFMAKEAGGTLDEFKAQLKTTAMFYDAKKATEFTRSKKVKDTMEYVRTFSFDNALFGEGAESKDFVGIQFPDGSVMGSKKNVKFRFTDKYMNMAAEGKL